MVNKKQGPEVNSETPLLKDFLARPELYARVIGEMVQDGTLNPEQIENSPALKECAQRIQLMEDEQKALANKEANEAHERIDRIVTALKALSLVFEGEKPELIEQLHQLAFDHDAEFNLVEPENTRLFGPESWYSDSNIVFFKNKTFAVSCFQGKKVNEIFIQPYEKSEDEFLQKKGSWRRMVRP